MLRIDLSALDPWLRFLVSCWLAVNGAQSGILDDQNCFCVEPRVARWLEENPPVSPHP